MQMRNWFVRFPTILQACESTVEILRGQYAHAVGYYSEAAFHFLEAAKVINCTYYWYMKTYFPFMFTCSSFEFSSVLYTI